MSATPLLDDLARQGVILEVVGDSLRCRAPTGVLTPELQETLRRHKVGILRELTSAPRTPPPLDHLGDPCPQCGSPEKWIWLDHQEVCRSCLIDGPPVAVKGWSDILQEAVWVTADDVPLEDLLTGAPVYRYAEVKLLKQLGPGVLKWVHATKEMFGACVVDSRGPAEGRAPDADAD